jgi:rod shape-determining protein MreD
MERFFTRIAWFIGLVFVQVLFLNHIYLFGLATPFLYIYLILVLDKDVEPIALMLTAFVLGLIIDMFCNIPGVNAGASVLLAFSRMRLLRLFAPREEFENYEPGIYTLGIGAFIRYALTATLLHHAVLFLLEAFSIAQFGYLALRVLCSAVLTVLLIIAIEFIRHRR